MGEDDSEVVIQICNVMVCTTYNQSLFLPVCVPDNREEVFEETFLTVFFFLFRFVLFVFSWFIIGNLISIMIFIHFIFISIDPRGNLSK